MRSLREADEEKHRNSTTEDLEQIQKAIKEQGNGNKSESDE